VCRRVPFCLGSSLPVRIHYSLAYESPREPTNMELLLKRHLRGTKLESGVVERVRGAGNPLGVSLSCQRLTWMHIRPTSRGLR
jgi:hypothetical protein